jgi:hypothetical protein
VRTLFQEAVYLILLTSTPKAVVDALSLHMAVEISKAQLFGGGDLWLGRRIELGEGTRCDQVKWGRLL